jgi:hypothetical protein
LATTDPEEREFTVVIPAAGREDTRVIPVDEWTPRSVPSESASDTAELPAMPAPVAPAALPAPIAARRQASRWSRFGAALFWIALGWWLFAAVRAGTAVLDLAYVDGTFRSVPSRTVLETVREATDRGREELLAVATLSMLAAVVLLAGRGRRWLGAVALLVAAGTLVTAVWHLAP